MSTPRMDGKSFCYLTRKAVGVSYTLHIETDIDYIMWSASNKVYLQDLAELYFANLGYTVEWTKEKGGNLWADLVVSLLECDIAKLATAVSDERLIPRLDNVECA
jgi:hypothetical protein